MKESLNEYLEAPPGYGEEDEIRNWQKKLDILADRYERFVSSGRKDKKINGQYFDEMMVSRFLEFQTI